jgi:hypothetical protein
MHIAALAAGPDDDEYTGELLPYITGEKNAPLPTYFVGGWGHGSKQALEALAGEPACRSALPAHRWCPRCTSQPQRAAAVPTCLPGAWP